MLQSRSAVLTVIDVQSRLLGAIDGHAPLLANLQRLAAGAEILELPVVWTEQLPEKLGPTVAELATQLPGAPIIKSTFSCCGVSAFTGAIAAHSAKQVIVAGIEAHVCVYQTVRDLLARSFEVFIVADAISSRTAENRHWAIERMRDDGARLMTTEMVLFELLGCAGTATFREVLKLVR